MWVLGAHEGPVVPLEQPVFRRVEEAQEVGMDETSNPFVLVSHSVLVSLLLVVSHRDTVSGCDTISCCDTGHDTML